MEQVELYDDNVQRTGLLMDRTVENMRELEGSGKNIPSNHICLFNSKGEMLIQRRARSKSYFGGYWDISAGGGTDSGETFAESAERELYEELGVKLEIKDRRPNLIYSFRYGYAAVFVEIVEDVELGNINSEVEEVKWVTQEEVLELLDNNNFIPYNKNFIGLLYDMGCGYKILNVIE